MKFYHGTSIEGLEGIIHDGGFNSTVSNWLVSDSTRVYMASVGQDYWDYSEEEPDLDDNLANGLLDEDGPAAIAGEDIWAGDDDEDIEYDDNYDDFMFD